MKEKSLITRRGKFWLRVVRWDMLPHLFDHEPTGPDDLSRYKRITWGEYRHIIVGMKPEDAAKIAMERLCNA